MNNRLIINTPLEKMTDWELLDAWNTLINIHAVITGTDRQQALLRLRKHDDLFDIEREMSRRIQSDPGTKVDPANFKVFDSFIGITTFGPTPEDTLIAAFIVRTHFAGSRRAV